MPKKSAVLEPDLTVEAPESEPQIQSGDVELVRAATITAKKGAISSALDAIIPVISSRPSHPVLASALLEAGDSVHLTGFDLSTGIKITVEGASCDVASFRICIPAKLIKDLVSKLQVEEVAMEFWKGLGWELRLFAGGNDYIFPCIDANEYPALPDVEGEEAVFTWEQLQAIARTAVFASSDETKGVMQGVRVETLKESIFAYATDGHRAAKVLISEAETQIGITIPGITAHRFGIFSGAAEITLTHSDSDLQLSTPGVRLYSRTLQGQYPNIEQLIPRQFAMSLDIPAEDLLRTLDRAAIVHTNRDGMVKLTFAPTLLEVFAQSESGKVAETIPLAIAALDDLFVIGMNRRYLAEGLKFFGDRAVYWHSNTNKSPVVLKTLDDTQQYLIMPVQIR
jgi:DNA polymerase-3 subunit beta